MGIMAAAALAGGGAVLAGVAVETLGMIAIGATVVGVATGNKTLTKIGAGLGLGSFVAGPQMLNLGAKTVSAGTAAAGQAGTPLADAATVTGDASMLGDTASAATGALPEASGAVNYGLTSSAAPASGVPQTSMTGKMLGQGLQGGTSLTGVASTPLAEGGISAWADAGVSASGTVKATWYAANSSVVPALQSSSGFWGGFKDWFNKLDSPGKLAVGQMGAGLIKGVGEGIAASEAEDRKYGYLENERDWRRNNLNYQPNFNFSAGLVNSASRSS